MLSEIHKKKIESALVHIEKKGGRGTLIFGEFVLTAAHCINWDSEGPMALGDWFPEPIKTSCGQSFILTPVALEPLSDIAVLGEIDNQEYPDDADRFEAFRDGTEPIEICETAFKRAEGHEVYMLDLEMNWVTGKVTRWSPYEHFGQIYIETEAAIRGGCSGGPVVNSAGQVVGVISTIGGTESEEKYMYKGKGSGHIPLANFALPAWVRKRILDKGPTWINEERKEVTE